VTQSSLGDPVRPGAGLEDPVQPSLVTRPGLASAGPGLTAVVLLRGAYGVALCCAPGPMISLVAGGGASPNPGARAVARVLGARHLAQAVLSAARPTPAVLSLGAGVDVLHSASMLALAAVDRPRWRLGLTDGVIAGAFAASGFAAVGRSLAASSAGSLRARR
jgi:hypothetical protein